MNMINGNTFFSAVIFLSGCFSGVSGASNPVFTDSTRSESKDLSPSLRELFTSYDNPTTDGGAFWRFDDSLTGTGMVVSIVNMTPEAQVSLNPDGESFLSLRLTNLSPHYVIMMTDDCPVTVTWVHWVDEGGEQYRLAGSAMKCPPSWPRSCFYFPPRQTAGSGAPNRITTKVIKVKIPNAPISNYSSAELLVTIQCEYVLPGDKEQRFQLLTKVLPVKVGGLPLGTEDQKGTDK